MFEFHGWANIQIDYDSPFIDRVHQIGAGPWYEAVKALRTAVNDAHDEFSLFDIQQCGNGMLVLMAHGLRNHRFEPVIDLFRWVAENLPGSYGLLYIEDDELPDEETRFKAWRRANGRLTEHEDPFLSNRDSAPEADDEE